MEDRRGGGTDQVSQLQQKTRRRSEEGERKMDKQEEATDRRNKREMTG